LAVGAASQGGTLTLSDLRQVCAVDQVAMLLSKEGEELEFGATWAALDSPVGKGVSAPFVVCAGDAHGRFAGLFCNYAVKGLAIEELELIAPFAASPVIRGIPRVKPGSPLPSAMPLTVRLTADGSPCEIEARYGAGSSGGRYAVRQQRGSRAMKITRPRQ
jgi:gamma-glutamyltranspeptidase/glutathione hydrolase